MGVAQTIASSGIRTLNIWIALRFLTITYIWIIAVASATAADKESNHGRNSYLIANKSFFKLPAAKSNIEEVGDRRKRASGDVTYNVGTIVAYTAEEKVAIQQRHVELRGQVDPEASNMEYMKWDDDLATMGEQWSSACLWEHGQPDNISPYDSLGQNLWSGTGSLASEPDPVPAVTSWYNEVQYYDYDATSCETSRVCGHYTQVVWASSMYVGCGRAFCGSVSGGFNNAWVLTCNYAPAGNYAGAKPYKSGDSCTQCNTGIGTCHTNQCRACSEDGATCECKAVCKNCGNITSECSCTCQNGWYGSDCNTECVDTHDYCGVSPGWPNAQSCSLGEFVPRGCPLMCGVCSAATGNEVCGGAVTFTMQRGLHQLLVIIASWIIYWT